MLNLSWNPKRNQFGFSFNLQKYNYGDFDEIKILFKELFLKYENYKWYVDKKRIDELLLWCERYKYPVIFDEVSFKKIEELKKQLKRETKFFRNAEIDYSILNKGKELFECQKEGILYQLQRSRVYNADDPGLGKTLQGSFTFSQWYKEEKIDAIFIITRNGLEYQWKREILDFINVFEEKDIVLITNENKKGILENIKDKKIIIIANHLVSDLFCYYCQKQILLEKQNNKIKFKRENQEKKIRTEYKNLIKNCNDKKEKNKLREKRKKEIKNIIKNLPLKKEIKRSNCKCRDSQINILEKWDKHNLCLIIDEAHEFTEKSLKTKMLRKNLISFCNYRIFLSATPWINKFFTCWNQLNLLDKSIVPFYSQKAFIVYIADKLGSYFNRYDIESYNTEKVEDISKRFQLNIIKRLKKDIPEMKTKRIIRPIYTELSSLQKNLYYSLIEEGFYDLNQEYDEIDRKKIFQKFPYILMSLDNPLLLKNKKIREEIDILEKKEGVLLINRNIKNLLDKWTFDQDCRLLYVDGYLKQEVESKNEKIIIMDTHPMTLDSLYKRYKKYNPLLIHGGLKDTKVERQKKIDSFNFEEEHKILLCSLPIIGAGFNLHYKCNRIIMFTSPYDTRLFTQAIDRIFRIVSTEDSIIDIMLRDKTIDLARHEMNEGRTKINDLLSKKPTKEEIKNLFNGIF